ncbi:MAG TPA: hypothetical protein VF573_00080 [Paraburkholderia sp.]
MASLDGAPRRVTPERAAAALLTDRDDAANNTSINLKEQPA